ncbi:MAG: hypothetical protein KZY55_13575 [Paeniclostridium sp.]|nr:DNA polymerase [Paeniclostridium sp.]MBW4861650.1 hypothetical protein [Paeniclostridium sp.]MBW4875086.1 hypothetical protein [Paeniclostridium sp.]
MKKILSIDIETYCEKDLAKCSVYSYIEDKSFKIILFAYAFDNEKVKIIDLQNDEKIPKEIEKAIYDKKIIKTAFNANFERICLSKYFKKYIEPSHFNCTMVNAMYLGLPQSLEKVGKILNLKDQKLEEGKKLIKIFSKPNKNKIIYSGQQWEDFKDYCIRDVEVERQIRNIFKNYKLPLKEQHLWQIDQKINDKGVLIEESLIENCLKIKDENNEILKEKLKSISNIKNPKSAKEVKEYLKDKYNFIVNSLNKENTEELINSNIDENIKEILILRKEICRTSLKKFEAMKNCACKDKRIRGLFQFYGASKTGRWAGRLVQVQNLPQNKINNIENLRSYINENKNYDLKYIENNFGKISQTLPQLIRTVFVPKKNYKFIIADFSAIEARILSWLSEETWRNEVFKSHGKIYEASAAKMFNLEIDDITKDSEYRQKGKIAELALGYQGGKGALKAMGACKMGLSEKELEDLVKSFRKSNKNIVKLWREVEKSAIYAVENKTTVTLKNIIFSYERNMLFIKLPSERSISYVRPKIIKDNYGKKLVYEGINQVTKKWGLIETYGGKLVENIVQGIARDCLCEAILNLDKFGFDIVMHVHDEIVLEVKALDITYLNNIIKYVKAIMEQNISWGKGLVLRVDLFESNFYKKG